MRLVVPITDFRATAPSNWPQASAKQPPTNQRDADNSEEHEPNEIHPEDYGKCVAAFCDESIVLWDLKAWRGGEGYTDFGVAFSAQAPKSATASCRSSPRFFVSDDF